MCPRPTQVVTSTATQSICPSSDIDFWPSDLGTGMQFHPWHGQLPCQFWWYATSLSNYGQTRAKQTTWRYNLDLWPLRSYRSGCYGNLGMRRDVSYKHRQKYVCLIRCICVCFGIFFILECDSLHLLEIKNKIHEK